MGGQRRLEEFGDGREAPAPPPLRRERVRPPALPGTWAVEEGQIVHPLLAPGSLRALPFQLDLARVGLAEDLLVVLPTGLGKTVIAALLAAERIRAGDGKVLFLAPTRPLVEQHAESFGRWIVGLRPARFSGSVKSPIREGSWEGAEAVFATPQIIENDLAAGRYRLSDVGLLIFDEAHRAVGKYSYVRIAELYREGRPENGRVLALTASPGGDPERIESVVAALGVARVEARQRTDDGVREYVQPVRIEQRWVELPPAAREVQELLRTAVLAEGRKLQKMGFLRKKPLASLSMKDIVALRGEIFARPGPMVRRFGPLYHQLLLLHLHHALERLETQGAGVFLQYLERVAAKPKPSKGDRALGRLDEVERARTLARAFLESPTATSHPKLELLGRIVDEELRVDRGRLPRILVFAQYRDTIAEIQESLEGRGLTVGRFVGQATRDPSDKGMKQADQAAVLDGFRRGRFPVLVASSVAEEGIDVPDVDLVVFFEAIPSEIRAIQRRGRTGRSSLGRVVVLLTAGTRDVGYQLAEARREASMTRVIRRLSRRGRERGLGPSGGPAAPAEGPEAPRPPRVRSPTATGPRSGGEGP